MASTCWPATLCNGVLYRVPDTGDAASHALKPKRGEILAMFKLGAHSYAAVGDGLHRWDLEFDPDTPLELTEFFGQQSGSGRLRSSRSPMRNQPTGRRNTAWIE